MLEQKNHVVDLLFSLALFCVFAATSLLVVIMGADVYQSTVNDMSQNYGTRTSLSYLSEKIRQNDRAGGISTDTIDGQDALVLSQVIGENTYETWIYTYDGQLCEVMVAAGSELEPSMGQPIMEIGSFEVTRQEHMILLTATDLTGNTASVSVFPRCIDAID